MSETMPGSNIAYSIRQAIFVARHGSRVDRAAVIEPQLAKLEPADRQTLVEAVALLRRVLEDAAPAVTKPDDGIAVSRHSRAHDRADDSVQARAIAAAGQDPDSLERHRFRLPDVALLDQILGDDVGAGHDAGVDRDHVHLHADQVGDGGDEDGDRWNTFAASSPRWRDQTTDWDADDDALVDLLSDDQPQVIERGDVLHVEDDPTLVVRRLSGRVLFNRDNTIAAIVSWHIETPTFPVKD